MPEDPLADRRSPPTPRPPRRGRIRPLARRLYRLARGALALGMIFILALVFTPLTEQLHGWLIVTEPAKPADYIVCLGGRAVRLIWAAELYHQGFAPRVIVTNYGTASAEMRDIIVRQQVPPESVLVDYRSLRTADHPASIANLPGVDPDKDTFLLVTDDEHSRRVANCFRKGGFEHFTIYAGHQPGDFLKTPEQAPPGWKPKMYRWRIQVLPRIAYEYAALLLYWWNGYI